MSATVNKTAHTLQVEVSAASRHANGLQCYLGRCLLLLLLRVVTIAIGMLLLAGTITIHRQVLLAPLEAYLRVARWDLENTDLFSEVLQCISASQFGMRTASISKTNRYNKPFQTKVHMQHL